LAGSASVAKVDLQSLQGNPSRNISPQSRQTLTFDPIPEKVSSPLSLRRQTLQLAPCDSSVASFQSSDFTPLGKFFKAKRGVHKQGFNNYMQRKKRNSASFANFSEEES
jgi:hypothetical protein